MRKILPDWTEALKVRVAEKSNYILKLRQPFLSWSLAGKLNSDRRGHGVIYDGSTFLVVGGDGRKKTENCVLDGTVMECTEQESYLYDYYRFPALFLTDENYGADC